eukprot:8211876-Pyramimonas_sp.AAC.1
MGIASWVEFGRISSANAAGRSMDSKFQSVKLTGAVHFVSGKGPFQARARYCRALFISTAPFKETYTHAGGQQNRYT